MRLRRTSAGHALRGATERRSPVFSARSRRVRRPDVTRRRTWAPLAVAGESAVAEPDGRVQRTDFGAAKLFDGRSDGGIASSRATRGAADAGGTVTRSPTLAASSTILV